MDERLDTFPRLMLEHASLRPNAPATREKYLGIWQTWTWGQVAEEVRALACGLAAQGFRRGMHLAIIGDNRPRLYWSMIAAQSLGGIAVPMYQDAPAAEFDYVLNDAEIVFAIVEDQEQVDKILEAAPKVPSLKHIYYDDPRGLRSYEGVTSVDHLREIGREYDVAHPDFYNDEVAKGRPGDVSIVLYTSGTTGKPKGVCQTHAAFIISAQGGCEFDKLDSHDSILSYLPMAWVGDHLFSYAQWLAGGFTINCPESGDTVMTDLREIGPTYYFAPPRVFENLLTQVMIRMEDASAIKRGLFRYFTGVARRCGDVGREAGRAGRSPAVRARERSDLRTVAQRPRHEPHPGRVHRGRRHRPRSVPFLPLDRDQPEAALRLDRDLRLRLSSARPWGQIRHRRRAGAGCRDQDRRRRRGAGAGTDAAQGILQASRCDRGIDRRRGFFSHRGRRLDRRQRAAQDHRPRQGRRQNERRRDVRAQL